MQNLEAERAPSDRALADLIAHSSQEKRGPLAACLSAGVAALFISQQRVVRSGSDSSSLSAQAAATAAHLQPEPLVPRVRVQPAERGR